MANNFQQQLLLYAWLPKPAVVGYVENQCIEEEVKRKDEILKRWENAKNALIDICLSLDKTVPEVSDIRVNEQTIIYSSENTDFRFLGAIQKPLAEIDLDTSSTGGLPTRGLVMLFGYGGSPVNLLRIGNRN